MIDINELILTAIVAGCFFAIPIIAAFIYLEERASRRRLKKLQSTLKKWKNSNAQTLQLP